jgi:hypothetical protein
MKSVPPAVAGGSATNLEEIVSNLAATIIHPLPRVVLTSRSQLQYDSQIGKPSRRDNAETATR